MKSEYIDVKGKWGIVVCYDLMRRDVREMRALMEAVGLGDDEIDGYLRMLLYHKNKGLCISNMELAMSLVFIGEATSQDQWFDTLIHELKHVVENISEFYHVDPTSEESAYLQGEIGRQMFPLIIRKFCREKDG